MVSNYLQNNKKEPNCATLTNDPVECNDVIAEHKLNNQPVDEFTQGACPKYFLCTII